MATYLLRVNLDIEDKSPIESLRLQSAVNTIRLLLKKGNRVVILSHFGRPRGLDPKLSLKRFHKILEKKLGERIVFFKNFNFKKMRAEIMKDSKTRLFMLENLRFVPGEEKNSPVFAKRLASLGNRYMNDDFATSHRKEASLVAITRFLPSAPGPTLLKEVTNLHKAMVKPHKPLTLVIGGAKMKDKIGVIHNPLSRADYVLLGGGAANTFLKAGGADIGSSLFDPGMLREARKLLVNKKIVLPLDICWGGTKILDIGPRTVSKYREVIKASRTIIWGGPMGYFENKRFARGSYEIARAIAASRAFSVVGGAETGEIIAHLKLQHKVNLLSTGGGAMLAYLAGEELPGLKALKIKHQAKFNGR